MEVIYYLSTNWDATRQESTYQQGRIKDAILFFEERQIKGNFIASDIFKLKGLEHKFDLIICHDVIEHIKDKATFLSNLPKYINPEGIIFMSFPRGKCLLEDISRYAKAK